MSIKGNGVRSANKAGIGYLMNGDDNNEIVQVGQSLIALMILGSKFRAANTATASHSFMANATASSPNVGYTVTT
ncbi:hypothetical protein DdX_02093 [Ditylenchus destructor]|uniref:Uncharacterized protein n=1 Tax=Ditylenchus destructor TaxID=166010 RepID=A0AAD4NC29_9BILA|nr:hypothetical protein DdX_02093 [Ditylenchus destructor]